MNHLQDFARLDPLADRLSDPIASVEHKAQALADLEQGLSQLSPDLQAGSSGADDERSLARAAQITAMTQLGELPELAAMESLLDAETRDRLRSLCTRPMSQEVEADFTAALAAATQTALQAAARLRDMRRQADHARAYRDLLRGMLTLLDLLLGNAPEAPLDRG